MTHPITATSAKHLYAVDYIRAIASLSVAIFHLGGKAIPILKFGWLGVEMFFVLSGFIICWSMPAFYSLKYSGKFILKRIMRIEPPYLISLFLLLSLNWLTIDNYKPDWNNVFLHFGYLNNFYNKEFLNPVYWTLGLEFQYYLFIALTFPLILKSYGKWLILLVSLLPLFIQVPGQTLSGSFSLFGLGMTTYLFLSHRITNKEFLMIGLSLIVSGIYLVGWLNILAGIVSVLFILAPLPKNKIITFFSKISFSLYLTHDIIGSRLVVYLGTLFPKTMYFKGLFFLTGIAVSILFAWLYYLIVEKPFFSVSKLISYAPNKLQLQQI